MSYASAWHYPDGFDDSVLDENPLCESVVEEQGARLDKMTAAREQVIALLAKTLEDVDMVEPADISVVESYCSTYEQELVNFGLPVKTIEQKNIAYALMPIFDALNDVLLETEMDAQQRIEDAKHGD